MRKLLVAFLLLLSSASFADTYPAISTFYYGVGWNQCISTSAQASADCFAKQLNSSVATVTYDYGLFGKPSDLYSTYGPWRTFLFTIPGYWNEFSGVMWVDATCPGGGTVSSSAPYTFVCINAPACTEFKERNRITGICELPRKSNGGSCPVDQANSAKTGKIDFGNPINAGTGNKWQHEIDVPASAFSLGFDRYYNASTTANSSSLGAGWSHAYTRSSTVQYYGTWVTIQRNDGKEYNFSQSAGGWVADADVPDRLEELKDSAGVRTGWRYTTANKSVETYTASGKLTSITERTGLAQTLAYSDASTPTTVAPATGLLIRVTDGFGHPLNFTYDTSSRIAMLTDPAGGVYRYAYDTNNNLASVTYPDGASKTYHYENTAFPHALTGITDENGNRYATYTYDAQGRGISTEYAGGAERFSFAYNADGSTTVTDALGTPRTYQFQTLLGVVKSKGQSQPGGSGCGASASALTYDANGNVASRTDFNGNRTNYTYDLTRNLETSRTEGLTSSGATTPVTRTVTTAWHPTFRLPVQINQGNQQTTYAYNPQGDLTDKTVKDLAANTTRSWQTTYTYSSVPGVLLQKVEDGPRTDLSDVTTYDYYPADAACEGGHLGCRGQLKQITDALGHSTQLTRYSAHGQVEQLTDPNGLVTTLTYDQRQRLTSLDAGGEITTYTYDPAGQLTRVTRPDGAYLAYSYDAAHRLIKTQDDQGNTLSYTLDAMGNRIKEEAYDPGGQLARSQSRVYDALSRLQNLVLPQ
jgi:YD repeat-containing protein